jgi:hypothetical protein
VGYFEYLRVCRKCNGSPRRPLTKDNLDIAVGMRNFVVITVFGF